MGGLMGKKLTGVQLNQSHTDTDEFITRTHVLPLLTDKAMRERLIAEHRDNPIGKPGLAGAAAVQHSPELQRVLDKLRRAPQAGKYVTIVITPHADYRIGIVSGVRGKPVRVLAGSYPSTDACEHAIFLKRISELLARYGHEMA